VPEARDERHHHRPDSAVKNHLSNETESSVGTDFSRLHNNGQPRRIRSGRRGASYSDKMFSVPTVTAAAKE